MTDQDIINLRSADPFADVTGASASDSGATGQRSSNLIHIRIQQRSGKKTLTTVQVKKTDKISTKREKRASCCRFIVLGYRGRIRQETVDSCSQEKICLQWYCS